MAVGTYIDIGAIQRGGETQDAGMDIGAIQREEPLTYVEVPYSQRMQHTGGVAACAVVMILGPRSFSSGDIIKVQGKFSAGDSGSLWLKNKCNITIFEV